MSLFRTRIFLDFICTQCIFEDSSSGSGAFIEWKCFAKSWELSYLSTDCHVPFCRGDLLHEQSSYEHVYYHQSHALAAAQVFQLKHNTEVLSSDARGRELIKGQRLLCLRKRHITKILLIKSHQSTHRGTHEGELTCDSPHFTCKL